MAAKSAEAAVVHAFKTPCVAKAARQPKQIALLKDESSWKRDDFVVEASWVANADEKYRSEAVKECASAVVEAMDAQAAAKPVAADTAAAQ